jgi:hypothetical protein
MPRKIKGVLVDTANQKISEYILIYNNHKDLCPLLNCDIFTIVTRKYGKHYYDIYADDEGLYKDPLLVSTFTMNQKEIIFGNVFICNHVKTTGAIKSLTAEQIKEILATEIKIINHQRKILKVLVHDF